ncbi:P-loop containing nucleoside triphosphate hydrolase protein [Boletus reticuloceps]|uniref:P-loop containing nucleoside triphosphate hydrolase protein n=1 Tax=Boletus reticuloceps TaxID=495285 RepID=A0A8I2YTI6_9AGAM|nr:P-loop containing nucleoside triphosphate hydrolase protein [Boletus reticuloceps]
MSSSLNVILFGETGVGKSSVINLIAGRHVAATSPGVEGCTMSFRPYSFPVNSRTFHIWDTVGLEEPEMGANGYLPAIEQACELIHNLSSQDGVDLLLFCMRGNRVTATTQSNYRLFFEVLCKSQVPIALVITHLEREVDMENWWERNAESLEKYGIKTAGHACVTGLPTHSKHPESQRNIARLLKGHKGQGRFNMPPERWLVEFLRLFGLFAPLKKECKKKDIVKLLTKRCKLDPKVAEELATKLEAGSSWSVGKWPA